MIKRKDLLIFSDEKIVSNIVKPKLFTEQYLKR